MRLRNVARQSGRARSAKTLVLFVLVAPVLIGMMGLVVDTGMLMASYRQTRNAADAAAMAAAMDHFRGSNNTTALATAQSIVTNNGMSATLTLTTDQSGTNNVLNIPPATGPYSTGSTNTNYAEVIVSQTVNTFFIQILGVN